VGRQVEDGWKDREITRLKDALEDLRRQMQGLNGEKDELLAVIEKLKEGITNYKAQLTQSEAKRKAEKRRSHENASSIAHANHESADELLKVKEQLFLREQDNTELVLKVTKMGSELSTPPPRLSLPHTLPHARLSLPQVTKMGSELSTVGAVVRDLQASNRSLTEAKADLQAKVVYAPSPSPSPSPAVPLSSHGPHRSRLAPLRLRV